MILKSTTGISIGGKIDGQCKVKMLVRGGQIVVHGKIDGGQWTQVYYHGTERADVLGGVHGNMIVGHSIFMKKDWEAEEAEKSVIEEERLRLKEHNRKLEAAFDKLQF